MGIIKVKVNHQYEYHPFLQIKNSLKNQSFLIIILLLIIVKKLIIKYMKPEKINNQDRSGTKRLD